MIVSHEWLKQFVPHSMSAQEVGDMLSRHCVTLDGIARIGQELEPFVVARVVEAGRHPNSDHLWVTKVDDGSGELLDVVCGAPNVVEGTMYPFARTGTAMPGGLVIAKRKIRGETSNGMLCSAKELGLGEDHAGILALDTDAAPGTPLLKVLPLSDARIDLDVLPNRPDLLSHLGVAREVAAISGVRLHQSPVDDLGDANVLLAAIRGETEAEGTHAAVRIEDPQRCPRYVAVIIDGVIVGASPDWLRRRLDSIGLRSISNVVDATNYVLHAFGQPVHAFDLERLSAHTIVVRPTRDGESLVTLDGVERRLAAGTTVVCDAERPVALAGVMGGRESEVTNTTRRVLLEVAAFDARFVRNVRKAVGLNTDASYRFERGTDRSAITSVARFAAALITRVAGGEVVELLDVGAEAQPHPPVTIRTSRVKRLLGVDVTAIGITRRLESLGCGVRSVSEDVLSVTPPSWRHDLGLEVDLIEEVARLDGYDSLPDELRPFRPGNAGDDPLHLRSTAVRNLLVSIGFMETRPMPFTSQGDERSPRVLNPLAEDEPFLRASLLDTLSGRIEYNLSRMQRNIRLFEVGHVFLPANGRLPREEMHAAMVFLGDRRPAHFTEPRPPAFDEWDAKGFAERLTEIALPGATVSLEAEHDTSKALWYIVADGERRGVVKRLDIDAPEWAAAAFGVEVSLGEVASGDVAAPGSHAEARESEMSGSVTGISAVRFKSLPVTPAAEFDIAFIVPDSISASQIEAAIRKASGDLLEHVQLFDEYRGANLEAGTRSLAWRLTLRHPERTLRDKEIEGRKARILDLLAKEPGVRPRAT